jgi:Acyl-CoA dehydrogenase, C-terminal domain
LLQQRTRFGKLAVCNRTAVANHEARFGTPSAVVKPGTARSKNSDAWPTMNPERILIAAEAVGLGRAALGRAARHAIERVVFGRPIGQNQAI